MEDLLTGLALFAIPHLLSLLLPNVRAAITARIGTNWYKIIYSVVSLIGLGLIINGYRIVSAFSSPDAYVPWSGAKHITMLLVLIAFILLGSAHGKGYIRKWVRQPMSIGVLLWAVGHLLANGKVYDLWLFGTFAAVSVLDIVLSEMRGKVPSYEPRIRSDIIAVVAGLVLYAIVLFWFHPYVIGLPILG